MMAKKKVVETEREEEEMLLGSLTLMVGGAPRVVRVLNIWESHAFRAKAAPLFEPIARLVLGAQRTATTRANEEKGDGKDVPQARMEQFAEDSFTDSLPGLMPYLMGEGALAVAELPFLYAPELEEIRTKASDEELLDAGVEVLALLYPLFQKMLGLVPRLVTAGMPAAAAHGGKKKKKKQSR